MNIRCMYTYINICIYKHLCKYTYIYMCVCVCACTFIYVCMYIYILYKPDHWHNG